MRAALVLGLLALPFFEKKSEPERLKKSEAALATQLYLTARSGLANAAGSEQAKAVGESLGALASSPDGGHVGLKEAGKVLEALAELRKLSPKPSPLIPALAGPFHPSPEWVAKFDPNTDHAAVLAALTLLKAHPKVPTPIPKGAVLYEASHLDPDTVKFEGFSGVLHGVKAWHFAMNGFCGYAADEASKVPAHGDAKALTKGVSALMGKPSVVSEKSAEAVNEAAWILGEGGATFCLVEDKKLKEAAPRLRSLVLRSEAAGLSSPELTLLHAGLDCASGDVEAGQKRLLTLPQQGTVKTLGQRCAEKNESLLALVMGPTVFGKAILELAWGRLDQSGLLDTLGALPWVKKVRETLGTLGKVLDKAP